MHPTILGLWWRCRLRRRPGWAAELHHENLLCRRVQLRKWTVHQAIIQVSWNSNTSFYTLNIHGGWLTHLGTTITGASDHDALGFPWKCLDSFEIQVRKSVFICNILIQVSYWCGYLCVFMDDVIQEDPRVYESHTVAFHRGAEKRMELTWH